MEYAVEATGLTKRFGAFTAVDRVDFQVKKGEIYGFLGPNGAGKSTTIRMLCGILDPTEGEATVGGFSIRKDPDRIKERIGYMSQKFSLYNDLTVAQNIDFYAGIYGLTRAKKAERKAWALRMSGLAGKESTLTANLSGGWKQRLSLACSILHEPEIVFLDEPTAGVDPISRRAFWDLIYDFSHAGVTVFVTTHYMDEAEHCHRLVLIYAGAKIAEGTPASFKQEVLRGDVLEVACDPLIPGLEAIQALGGVQRASVFGDSLHVICEGGRECRAALPAALSRAGVRLTSAELIAPSLEDAFIELIARHDAGKGAR
jgi:ABC-2 type transport system ATP-binding protein